MKQTMISTILCTFILALFALAWLPSDVSAGSGRGGHNFGWSGAGGVKHTGKGANTAGDDDYGTYDRNLDDDLAVDDGFENSRSLGNANMGRGFGFGFGS